MCAKKIRRELEENSVEITVVNIQLLLGKIEVNLKEGAGYHRRGCELDDADVEDPKFFLTGRNNFLDRTEELETEDIDGIF